MVLTSGTKGWIGLVAYVLAYDLYAIRYGKQTLSSAFYEALKHPQRRWLVIISWAYLTRHLFGLDRYRWNDIRLALVRKGQRGEESHR